MSKQSEFNDLLARRKAIMAKECTPEWTDALEDESICIALQLIDLEKDMAKEEDRPVDLSRIYSRDKGNTVKRLRPDTMLVGYRGPIRRWLDRNFAIMMLYMLTGFAILLTGAILGYHAARDDVAESPPVAEEVVAEEVVEPARDQAACWRRIVADDTTLRTYMDSRHLTPGACDYVDLVDRMDIRRKRQALIEYLIEHEE